MRRYQFVDAITERQMSVLDALGREAQALADKIEQLRQGLIEGAPLTPEQARRRAERDRKRQDRMREIQNTAHQRVGKIRSEIGE